MIGDVLVSPFFIVSTYICDLKNIMRTRCMFGLYNSMYIPTRLRFLVKAYCIIFIIVVTLRCVFLIMKLLSDPFMSYYFIVRLFKFTVISGISLITDDSYISKLLTREHVTDVTLDSSAVFKRLQKYVHFMFYGILLFQAMEWLAYLYQFPNYWTQLFTYSPISASEIATDLNAINQFLVLFLLYCRVVTLRRKLERYGFRNIRNSRFRSKVFSEMYIKIMGGFQTLYYFKFSMMVDLLCDTALTIFICSAYARFYKKNSAEMLAFIISLIMAGLRMLVYLSLNCFTLNAVADQVNAMQTFVVTELIKNPSAVERRAMYDFLLLTDAMPPRFSLFRLVEVNVALLLTLVAFCSSRIVLFVQTFY